MTATVYSLNKARRRDAAPRYELPESWLTVATLFGFDTPTTFDRFYLCRCKRGTEVSIIGGKLTVNLSYFSDNFPATFPEARKWVAAMAERYNWTMVETNRFGRPKEKRACKLATHGQR